MQRRNLGTNASVCAVISLLALSYVVFTLSQMSRVAGKEASLQQVLASESRVSQGSTTNDVVAAQKQHRELAASWRSVSQKRVKVLETQSLIWAAKNIDSKDRQSREFSSSVASQQTIYMLSSENARVVCEIGFKIGLGAANFLHANDELTYHGFDLEFPSEVAAIFKQRFGSRAVLHAGDSLMTVPQLNDLCNVIHIDGQHKGVHPFGDITNTRNKAACDNVVFSDDTFDCADFESHPKDYCWEDCNNCDCYGKGVCNEASHAWWKAVREGLVESYACFYVGTSTNGHTIFPKGWCVGHYTNLTRCDKSA